MPSLELVHYRLPDGDVLCEPVVIEAASGDDLIKEPSRPLIQKWAADWRTEIRRIAYRLGNDPTPTQSTYCEPGVQLPPATRLECGYASAQLPDLLHQSPVLDNHGIDVFLDQVVPFSFGRDSGSGR